MDQRAEIKVLQRCSKREDMGGMVKGRWTKEESMGMTAGAVDGADEDEWMGRRWRWGRG